LGKGGFGGRGPAGNSGGLFGIGVDAEDGNAEVGGGFGESVGDDSAASDFEDEIRVGEFTLDDFDGFRPGVLAEPDDVWALETAAAAAKEALFVYGFGEVRWEHLFGGMAINASALVDATVKVEDPAGAGLLVKFVHI